MAAQHSIDLNADLGESFGSWSMGQDSAMLGQVSSANIACGFHAGDPQALRTTLQAAAEAGVTVGAHPAYRDLAGFGRRFVDASAEELTADVLYQLSALDGLAAAASTRVRYIKPHGALYHACHSHPGHALAVVDALSAFAEATGRVLPLLLAPGALAHQIAAERGIPTPQEIFADRAYRPDGTLVSRREPGAVVTHIPAVAETIQRYAEEGTIIAEDGTSLQIQADSICLHGDTPSAGAMAEAVRAALTGAGVSIESFA
ncbi:LamB/YcsF family protein [Nesterenkonia ebinurensis]|uniref:LamB/YcsF family protein n=1 Tax=Nesterenkonia ebinurensis TaxID=2608252 RepID=UPI00123E0624|nr:5-oxoprolinase subunit PxpA [Nesterenkonia ebinurensis]